MIGERLWRRASAPAPVRPTIPSGDRVYAIGDIHGRLDLLEKLLDAIAAEERAAGVQATLIFLGDLIDRGEHSAQVVERLINLAACRLNVRFLLGNHEEVFLAALAGDERALRLFTRIGGDDTIRSYGLTEHEFRVLTFPQMLERLQQLVPSHHVEFLRAFEDLIIIGDYAFVHAGIRPDRPLASQNQADLRWIRDPFLNFKGRLEKMIVHGHTISEDIERREHRIGIDTGAFMSGKLSAIGLEGEHQWIIQT